MLYKVVLILKSYDVTIQMKATRRVLSCGTVYYPVQRWPSFVSEDVILSATIQIKATE